MAWLASLPGAGAAAAQPAGIETATIAVELSCPSCAQGLERRLGRLDGVEGVTVEVDRGRVTLAVRPGAGLDLDAAWQQVRNAGFLPDALTVTAVGRVIGDDASPRLSLPGDGVLVLRPGASRPPPVGERPVRLTGTIAFDPAGGPPALAVDRVRAIR